MESVEFFDLTCCLCLPIIKNALMRKAPVLLQAEDYYHRRLYAKELLPFYKSRTFRHSLLLVLLLYLPLFYAAYLCRPQNPQRHIQIVLQRDITRQLKNFQHHSQKNEAAKKDSPLPFDNSETKDKSESEKKSTQTNNMFPQTTPEQNNNETQNKMSATASPTQSNQPTTNFQNQFEQNLFERKQNSLQTNAPNANSSWQAPDAEQDALLKNNAASAQTKTAPKEKQQVRWQGQAARKALYIPQVHYPPYYLAKGIQAKGIFSIEVDASGAVIGVFTVKSTGYPGLDVEAKNALRAARFSATEETKRIDRGEIDVEFKLR